ncbi:MAG: LemA family protein [Planctomycetes bacterium]|nr:LemA family protein [Planctomycetota bacterium]
MLVPIVLACVIGGVILIASVIGIYNGLQRRRIAAEGAFADIDVELRRRHDLIPNLVETVKGYASHEKETLSAVMQARAAATQARTLPDRVAAEGQLTQTLGRLMAVAEAYPNLKADGGFIKLQGELAETENRIGGQRQGFNQAVASFNEAIAVFPSNIVAGIFGFTKLDFFKEDNEAARSAPQVKF